MAAACWSTRATISRSARIVGVEVASEKSHSVLRPGRKPGSRSQASMASIRSGWVMKPSPTIMSMPASESMRKLSGMTVLLFRVSRPTPGRADGSVVQQLARQVAAVQRAQGGQREPVLVEEIGDQREDLFVADRVDRAQHRVHREECAVVHLDRKSTRLNSSHLGISYAVFCL